MSLLPQQILPFSEPLGVVNPDGSVTINKNWWLYFYNLQVKALGTPGNPATLLAITQLTGDVAAGPGNGSVAATVTGVNGAAVPASEGVLGTNSSGQLIAGTVPSQVAGANTDVQYSNGTTFAGDSGFTYNSAARTVNIGDSALVGTLSFGGHLSGTATITTGVAAISLSIQMTNNTNGPGSALSLQAASGGGSGAGEAGGPLNLSAGNAGYDGAGGAVNITAGNGGSNSGAGGAVALSSGSGSATDGSILLQIAGATCAEIDPSQNIVLNATGAALATTATNGFTYIPTCAGTPTGTPTLFTGTVPLVYDTTGHKLWVYRAGAWAGVAI